jgi:phosphopantetheinyl transferase (holo-ACP synthase)
VGVDVVDLDDARCVGKHRDERFLARILADHERRLLSGGADGDETLWRIWAAKEAAFKVVSKMRGSPPPFVYAAFQVSESEAAAGFGRVSWEDAIVHVHWHVLPGRVAALAWNDLAVDGAVEWGWGQDSALDPDPGGAMEALLARLTERERGRVHSRASALVRLAAKAALADALGVERERVEVVSREGPKGRIPPEVLLDGEPARADVSLSHHGRWLAWGLRIPEPRRSAAETGTG